MTFGAPSQFSRLFQQCQSLLDEVNDVDVLVQWRNGEPWQQICVKPDGNSAELRGGRQATGTAGRYVDFLIRRSRLGQGIDGLPILPNQQTVVQYAGKTYVACSNEQESYLAYEDDDQQTIRFLAVEVGVGA